MQFLINARFNPTLVDLSHSRPRFPPVNTSRLTSGPPEVETAGLGGVSMREIDDQPAAPW
jgi:hypothetical protein